MLVDSLFWSLSRIRQRWSRTSRNVERLQPQHPRLNLEQLEQRVLLSTSILNATYPLDGGWAEAQSSIAAANQMVSIISDKDNTLYEDTLGTLSNGAGDYFFAGRQAPSPGSGLIFRGLVAFDIASNIPSGSTIVSATLRLHMSRTIAGPQDIDLHLVTADWGEGTSIAVGGGGGEGAGGPSTPGSATWKHTFHPDDTWTNLGGDFDATVSATTSVSVINSYFWTSAQLTADVQAWLDTPAGDFGWIVIGNEATTKTAKRFDTRENPTPQFRPLLTIEYENNPPTVDNLILDQNATEDLPFTFTVFTFTVPANIFDDIDGDTLTLSALLSDDSPLPAWLSFTGTTFTGTPLNADVGMITVKVTADDGNSGSVSNEFILTVDTNDPPTVAFPILDQIATEDSPFTFMIPTDTFDDINGDTLTLSALLADDSSLPTWLSFDGTTFTGTPLNADVGTITVKVTADDGKGGLVSDEFELMVANTNDPPTLENLILDQTATEDVPFAFTVPTDTFDDVDGDTLTLSALLSDDSPLPAWLIFDGANFTGTPLNADVGTITVKVTADDGNGPTASDEFDITVFETNDPPTLANPIPNQTATEDVPFAFTLPANTFDDEDGDTLTLSALLSDDSPLPGWLSFAGTGFTGTPLNADVGTITVKVTADDGKGGLVSDEFQLTVDNTNDPPTVAFPIADQTATEDVAFVFTVPANTFVDEDGDSLTLTARLSDDSPLPTWLQFNGATFTGTPDITNVGTIIVKVTADDGNTGSVSKEFQLTVSKTNNPPTLAIPIADQTANENGSFTFTVQVDTFEDIDGDTLTLSARLADDSSLPTWLSFDGATFTGTPLNADVGTITVKVTADDDKGGLVSDEFQLTVVVSPFVQVVLDTDRSTQDPNLFVYVSEEDGQLVKITLKGSPHTVATLILTRTDESGLQRLVSVNLASPQPDRTRFSAKTIGRFTVETITGNGAKMLDLRNADLIGNTINMTGPVSKIRVASIADGSHIQLGGSPQDRLSLTITGAAGTSEGTEGVNLVFPGLVTKLVAQAWYGGQWDVGSVGRVQITGGDFSPVVNIAGAFKNFQVRGGDFLSPEFHSGPGGKIRVLPDKLGNGGAIVSTNSFIIDGALKSLEGRSINVNLTAADEVKLIRARDNSGAGVLNGVFTARRFGKVESQGADAQFNLFTTGTAVELGSKAAVDAIKITGANWLGGQIETLVGTRIKSIQVRAKKGVGGQVLGTVDLSVFLVDKLQTGNILSDFNVTGNLKTVKVERIIGSTFHITGDVRGRFSTTSQGSLQGFVNGRLDLLNPADPAKGISDQAPGVLQIDSLIDPTKIKTL